MSRDKKDMAQRQVDPTMMGKGPWIIQGDFPKGKVVNSAVGSCLNFEKSHEKTKNFSKWDRTVLVKATQSLLWLN